MSDRRGRMAPAHQGWVPGDDPTTHPRWAEQVKLEMYMLRAGADQVLAQLSKAREKGQMTRLAPWRKLVKPLLADTVEGIKQWVDDCRRNYRATNRLPISFEYIAKIDPALAAYVTIRHVLDGMARGTVGLLHVAHQIGMDLEHEMRMQAWERQEPALFYGVRRALKRNHSTQVHRRRVNINRFNKLVAQSIDWHPWPAVDRRRIGLDLVDILVRFSGKFEVRRQNGLEVRSLNQRKYVLAASDEVMDWLMKAVEHLELTSPFRLPCVMPPRRWEGVGAPGSGGAGGYWTEYIAPRPLIRFKAHQEETHKAALEDYDSLDMPVAYRAVNMVQEVGWVVDQRVYRVARHLWTNDIAMAGFPPQKPEPLPPKPPDIEDNEQARKDWKREAYKVYNRRALRIAEALSVKRTLDVAERFRKFTFYFPHMLDFRGRMYPIPVDFQPQGRDLARGLMRFREARPVFRHDGSYRWIAIQLANSWGKDKDSYEDRIAFVEDQEPLWRSIDKNPLANTQWAQADSPWQALQAVFEWCRWLDADDGFLSSLPCRVDGTCNGIQHLSALTRDAEGGAAVNLTPSPKPRDIYAEVAAPLTERLKNISRAGGEEGAKADFWLEATDGALPRSLTKRPVMILPYGGTMSAYFTYIRDWLKDNRTDLLEDDSRPHEVAFLAKHLWDIVGTVASGGVRVMAWLKQCCREVAEVDQPIFWVVPSGFVVRHFYGKLQERTIRTKVDGQAFRISNFEASRTGDPAAQTRGVAPNYIHSLDAAALMLFLDSCSRENIVSLSPIHDNVGSLASDMGRVGELIREAFIQVHEADLLGEFRQNCKLILITHNIVARKMSAEEAEAAAEAALPAPLPKGTLDLKQVLQSDYFFS